MPNMRGVPLISLISLEGRAPNDIPDNLFFAELVQL